MRVSDLQTGFVSAKLLLRNGNGEELRVKGRVVEKKGDKYLIVEQSPRQSYGPGTEVCWWRKKKND